MAEEMSIDLFRERCAAMRAERSSEAWGIKIELPPPPSEADDSDEAQRLSAAEVEKRAREERRRVASASSGGPLRRLASG